MSGVEQTFFLSSADEVARQLLGSLLVSELEGVRCAGVVVETEAYPGPHDPASHAAGRIGRTARNAAMFGPGGSCYLYRIYGIHLCLNVVTGDEGFPAAVLVRAAQPVEGIGVMASRRGGRPERELMRGPGNLARALGVTSGLNGHDLSRPPLYLLPGQPVTPARVARGPRVGVTRATGWPLRFWVEGSAYVSASGRTSGAGVGTPLASSGPEITHDRRRR
ncbi:MAG: DNA-3-methyladenine glycosylase [Longimicrobiaceae bacterium]